MDVFVVDFFTDGVKASQRPFWKWHNIGGWYTSTRLVILFHRRLIFSPPLVTLLHRRLLVRTHRRVAICSRLWLLRQLIRIHPINRQYSHLHRNKPYLPPIDKVPHWPHFPSDTYSHITYKLWQHCSYSSRRPTAERYSARLISTMVAPMWLSKCSSACRRAVRMAKWGWFLTVPRMVKQWTSPLCNELVLLYMKGFLRMCKMYF